MTITDIQQQLSEKGLKLTPQRIAVLEAIIKLNNHPSAENIIDYIRKNYPNISTATVYKVLDALVDNELIKRVKTDKDVMRYDAILHAHHHLYCTKTDKIKDYFNDDLNHLLANYFKKHRILDFEIADIKLQIVGKFTSPKKNALKKRNSLPK